MIEAKEENFLFVAAMTAEVESIGQWQLDSACSNHMSGKRSLFVELDESIKPKIQIEDGTFLTANGKGTINIQTK